MKKISKKKVIFKKRRIFIALGVVAIVVLAAFFVFKEKEETIEIGAILALSGAGADIGEEIREGMLLAINEVNSRGGINNKKIKLIVEDCKTNPQEAKELFNKIEEAHHPLLYVSMLSSISLALAPLVEKDEVVLVGLVASAPELTKQKKWVFRNYFTSEAEVWPILSILEELKVKKLGILYLNDELGTSVFTLLKKGFEKTGGITKSEAYDPQETNFKEHITKLKETETIYVVGFGSHIRNVLEQLKEENFKGSILASSGVTHYPVRNMPQAQGVFTAAYIIYSPKFLFAREVKEKYEVEYGKPFTHRAANGYDFIRLLAGLLEDEEISRQDVKRVLEEGFTYPGVFGTIEVKPGEHDIIFPLYPAQIVDGKLEYLY